MTTITNICKVLLRFYFADSTESLKEHFEEISQVICSPICSLGKLRSRKPCDLPQIMGAKTESQVSCPQIPHSFPRDRLP